MSAIRAAVVIAEFATELAAVFEAFAAAQCAAELASVDATLDTADYEAHQCSCGSPNEPAFVSAQFISLDSAINAAVVGS